MHHTYACEVCENGMLVALTCSRCHANVYRCDVSGCVYTDLLGPLEMSSWRSAVANPRHAQCPCCSHCDIMPLRAAS